MSEVIAQKRPLTNIEEPDAKRAKLPTTGKVRASKILAAVMWSKDHWKPAINYQKSRVCYWEATKFWFRSIICGYLIFLFEQLEAQKFTKETKSEEIVQFYFSKLKPTPLSADDINSILVEIKVPTEFNLLKKCPSTEKSLQAAETFPEIFPTFESIPILSKFIVKLVQQLYSLPLDSKNYSASDDYRIIPIELIKKAINKETGALFKFPVDLDEWGYFIDRFYKSKEPLNEVDDDQSKDELIYWWKNSQIRDRIINRWLKGYKGHVMWKYLYARPLAYLGQSKCPCKNLYGSDYHFIVSVKDGMQNEHTLYILVNEGCADANTGIFGRISSENGVWMFLQGFDAGDCGTRTDSFPLAVQKFYPHKSYEPIPRSLAFSSENEFPQD